MAVAASAAVFVGSTGIDYLLNNNNDDDDDDDG